MAPKFCANLNFMFHESTSLIERYDLAAKAGFKYVECGNPYSCKISDLVKAKSEAKLEQILINTPVNLEKQEFGYAALGSQSNVEYMQGLKSAIEYAKALECRIIHIMSGVVKTPAKFNRESLVSNLRLANELLGENEMIGVIEAINNESLPGYYLNSYDTALEIVKEVNSPNIRLLLDIFHLQKIHGNLTVRIQKYLPYTKHIQIAQVPSRHEPEPAQEVNYPYIFNVLDELGYNEYIGLEYNPRQSTTHGLNTWIAKYGFNL